jgi:hypothetical protein
MLVRDANGVTEEEKKSKLFDVMKCFTEKRKERD